MIPFETALAIYLYTAGAIFAVSQLGEINVGIKWWHFPLLALGWPILYPIGAVQFWWKKRLELHRAFKWWPTGLPKPGLFGFSDKQRAVMAVQVIHMASHWHLVLGAVVLPCNRFPSINKLMGFNYPHNYERSKFGFYQGPATNDPSELKDIRDVAEQFAKLNQLCWTGKLVVLPQTILALPPTQPLPTDATSSVPEPSNTPSKTDQTERP